MPPVPKPSSAAPMAPPQRRRGAQQPSRPHTAEDAQARRTSFSLDGQRPYGETLDELDARLSRLELTQSSEQHHPGAQPMSIRQQRPRSPTILDLNDPFADDHVMQPLSPQARVPYTWQQSPRLYGLGSSAPFSNEQRDQQLLQQVYGISPRQAQATRLELPAPAVRPQLASRAQSANDRMQLRPPPATPPRPKAPASPLNKDRPLPETPEELEQPRHDAP